MGWLGFVTTIFFIPYPITTVWGGGGAQWGGCTMDVVYSRHEKEREEVRAQRMEVRAAQAALAV